MRQLEPTEGWRGVVFPEETAPWVLRAGAGEPFTVAQRREALRAWYEELAKGPDGGIPKTFTSEFRKSQAGFTDDMMDRTLLEGPPEGIDD